MPSQFRRHAVVTLDGVRHEIVTSAADSVDVPMAGATFGDTMRTIHRACLRLKVPDCPARFETFLDLLDDVDMPETNGSEPSDLDPTPPTPSAD